MSWLLQDQRMRFEVQKKHGKGWRDKGVFTAVDSAKAAGQAGFVHGEGTYRVRPEYSRDRYFSYKVNHAAK